MPYIDSVGSEFYQSRNGTPMWCIINQISELFVAYDAINITQLHSNPTITVTADEGNRICISSTDERGYDVSVKIAFPIDDEEMQATFLIAFGTKIIVTMVNGEFLDQSCIIAQYDAHDGMFFDDIPDDDATLIFSAHRDLLEQLLCLNL
jgi:hypothetical protein